MPTFKPRRDRDTEPLSGMVYEWSDYAMQKIREALETGAEPPVFRQESPWHWIYLSSVIGRDQELRGRVFIDIRGRRVLWERMTDDDYDELA